AERAVVGERFGGDRGAYEAALAQAHANPDVARGVIADELRRAQIEARLRVSAPSDSAIGDYRDFYGDSLVRLVQVSKRVAWLGGRARGYAIDSVAPPQVLQLPTNRWSVVRTMTGTYRVRPLGLPVPLGALP